MGLGGAAIFAAMTAARGQRLFPAAALSPVVLLRNGSEMLGTVAYVSAITLAPISEVSAILQATPLAVTLGAALVLGEKVGWRRWSAILAGFLGVILVIRPGMSGFNVASLLALVGVILLAIRDLATRRTPSDVSSLQLSFLAFLSLIPAAGLLSVVSPSAYVALTPTLWMQMAAAVMLAVLAYYAVVAAMRVGEVSYVTPFRYSRLLFALVIGVTVFGERPDALMLLGSAIIVASGVYTVWRERKLRRMA